MNIYPLKYIMRLVPVLVLGLMLSLAVLTAVGVISAGPAPVLATTGVSTNPVPDSGSVETKPLPNPPHSGVFTLSNPLKVDSIGGLVENFVEIFSYIVILLAVLALIFVGFQYIVSMDKPAKRQELNTWLLYIVIGVAVTISARLIVNVVINTLSATGTIDPNVIQSVHKAANPN